MAATAAFVAALLLGLLLPVYTDEIGWRFQERAGFDGVDKMYNDACGPNSLTIPPWFMWPVRGFSALLNGAFPAPVWVRLSGVGYALAWAALLALLIRRIADRADDRAMLGGIGFGLLALGNTPLLLVLSRPEQPIILAVAAALLLALPLAQAAAPALPPAQAQAMPAPPVLPAAPGPGLRVLAMVALAAVALSYHLKALFLMPLFVACALLCARGRASLPARVAGAVAICALTAIATRYWLGRLQCPGDAVLRAEYARNSIGTMLGTVRGAGDLARIAARLARNLSVSAYVLLARPEPKPLSFWLPDGQVGAAAAYAWGRALRFAWTAPLLLALIAATAALWRGWHARRLDPRLVAAAALVAAVLGWSATQLARNFYEAGFVLPLLVLGLLLALAAGTAGAAGRSVRFAGKVLAAMLALAAVVSVGLAARTWTPALVRAWGQQGYVAGQPFSLAIRGYAPMADRVRAAARACRLPPPARAHGLVLDELTYFPYMQSRRPHHWLGVFGGWKGEIDDPVRYLSGRGSDGILVACEHLPPALRARAHAAGPRGAPESALVCCLAPPGW